MAEDIFNQRCSMYIQSTLDNSKLTGLLKTFELPRVRIVEKFKITRGEKKFEL